MSSTEDKDNRAMHTRIRELLIDNLKGVYRAAQYFKIKLNQRTSPVSIIDKSVGDWSIRFDGPHQNYEFPHININSKITGVRDSHTPISPTTLKAAEGSAKVLKQVNKSLLTLAAAADAYRIGANGYEDYQQGTTRNTTTTALSVVGAWTGSSAGSALGFKIGSLIWPGFGTIAGAFAGGMAGGNAGRIGGEKMADSISEKYKHDIVNVECNWCKEIHECRKYAKQTCTHCSLVG